MEIAILMLRVIVGLTVVAHSAQKLFARFGGQGVPGTSEFLESLGFRPGRFHTYLLGIAELAGGTLLAIGLFTPLAAVAIIGVMTAAIAAVHWENGFFASNGGFELPFVLAAVTAAIAFAGPGAYSVDALLGLSLEGPAVGMAATILGLLAGLVVAGMRYLPERLRFLGRESQAGQSDLSGRSVSDEGSEAPGNGALPAPLIELNRLEDEIQTPLGRAMTLLPGSVREFGIFTPRTAIEEIDDAYVVSIQLPGIGRKDASVEIRGRRLIVAGQRIERKGVFRARRLVSRRFRYEALLPGEVDADAVTTSFEDGVLVVRVPKAESERSKVSSVPIP